MSEEVINKLLKEHKEYFDNMFTSINKPVILDDEQRKAILNDDHYVLILAGAGTGKTTTMVGKIKYLVDIKKVDPSKILVISYTKKAVEELQEIIIDEFGINTNVKTFHSLAYSYIRNLFKNRKCEIIDFNEKERIFCEYINEMFKENKIEDILSTFNKETLQIKNFFYGKYFIENYHRFNDYDSFFEEYKDYKIKEAKNIGIKNIIEDWIDKKLKSEYIITLKGELVKSASEAKIANFLFKHGIDYIYEKVYDEIVEDRKIYKPDFTLDLAGKEVYLEYFGLDDEKYNRIKNKKIQMHKQKGNNCIFIESTPLEEIEIILEKELKEKGFIFKDKTDEEIFTQILNNNKLSSVFKLKNLFYSCIEKIKENPNRENYQRIIKDYINTLNNDEKKLCLKQFKYFNEFYVYYSKQLYGPEIYKFDYTDLLYYSNKYIDKKGFLEHENYDYIIIDEYQDISDGEYTLARNTSNKKNASVFAVGDDWQSIYSFRGSKIKYITNFEEYFKNPTKLEINKVYRNAQELVNVSSAFVKENPSQIKKNLTSSKSLPHPIYFVDYDDRITEDMFDFTNEYKILKELILKIHEKTPEHSILILARTNKMIDACFESDSEFIDDLGTKIKLESAKDIEIDGMTIHKSKGLTYDEVIIIGLNNTFPHDYLNYYWLIDLFEHELEPEEIQHAEERRLFYVALTRTKNNVFILKNKNTKNRSKFVDEIYEKCKEIDSESYK